MASARRRHRSFPKREAFRPHPILQPKGIPPEAVNDEIVDDYMRYRAKTTALATDVKARRAIARGWNASRGLKDWPQQKLTEPPLKKIGEWPRWDDFPPSLHQECRRISEIAFSPSSRRRR